MNLLLAKNQLISTLAWLAPKPMFNDYLIWIMIIVAVGCTLYALKREYWRNAYRQAANNTTAAISFLTLALLLCVALLDSINLQPYKSLTEKQAVSIVASNSESKAKVGDTIKDGAERTALDIILGKIILPDEKSYSEPFSTQRLDKISRKNDEGKLIRFYQPLIHVSKALRSELAEKEHADASIFQIPKEAHNKDLAIKFAKGAGISLAACLLTIPLYYFIWIILGFGRLQTDGKAAPKPCKKRIISILSFVTIATFTITLTIYLSQYYHILGTDKTGKSVLYITLKSIRTGIIIGTLTTFIIAPVSVIMGVSAGYFKGWIDDIIQFVYTTLSSIPSILLIIAVMLIVNSNLPSDLSPSERADFKLFWLCVVLAITSWANICRLVRAETLKLREIEYVQAATALGQNHFRIILKHIIPNVMHIVLITIILRFSGLVLSEAVLAYIGVGLDPSTHSWGNMIVQAQSELSKDPVVWWNFITALVFMILLVLPANLLGDAVRDALDPRLRTQSD